MALRRLRLGMVGGGRGAFFGAVHRRAAAMTERFEFVAGALSSDSARLPQQRRQVTNRPSGEPTRRGVARAVSATLGPMRSTWRSSLRDCVVFRFRQRSTRSCPDGELMTISLCSCASKPAQRGIFGPARSRSARQMDSGSKCMAIRRRLCGALKNQTF